MASPAVSIMYPVARERLDFVADGITLSFATRVPARSNYVEVFRNGLLQRAGQDYLPTPISGVDFVVNFLQAPGPGDYITLFYYR